MPQLLGGLTILIVEDEFLAALETKDMIEERGGIVVGPVGRLDQALDLVRSETLDAAVLDVSLDGDKTYPLADELTEKGVPVVFVTGYSGDMLPERFAETPRVGKPASRRSLEDALRSVLPAL